MAEEEKKKTPSKETPHKRDLPDQPSSLPGIRRFQFFSDVSHRTLTRNLNRAAMLGIAAAFAADVIKPILSGVPQTIYCYECRACYATQDKCPVGISLQAELSVSSRVADYERFIKAKGLKCIRCGNCTSFCVINLNLPRIFSRMQVKTIEAMKAGKIPRPIIEKAYQEGQINRLFINDVAAWLKKY